MSAHSIGGPAWRIVRSPMSGSRSRATPTPASSGCASSRRATASSFARAIASASPRQPRERLLAAGLGRAPLDALDAHVLALELVGEQVDARVGDRQRRGPSRSSRPLRPPLASFASARRRARCRASTTAPAASSRSRWPSSPCGSPSAPHQRDDHVLVDALDHRRQLAGRVGVGAVAEHDVEQQHGDSRDRARRRAPRSAATDRSSGARGPAVYSSSPKSVNSPSPTIAAASVHSVPPL